MSPAKAVNDSPVDGRIRGHDGSGGMMPGSPPGERLARRLPGALRTL